MGEKCTLCPHKCSVDRRENLGRCKAGEKIEIRTEKVCTNLRNHV